MVANIVWAIGITTSRVTFKIADSTSRRFATSSVVWPCKTLVRKRCAIKWALAQTTRSCGRHIILTVMSLIKKKNYQFISKSKMLFLRSEKKMHIVL